MPRRKLLLVAYLFPPTGGVGVQRAISFVKYLPPLGCEVIVLTARNPAAPATDPSLLARIPKGTAIHRTFTPEPTFEFREKIQLALGQAGRPRTTQQDLSSPSLFGRLKRALRHGAEWMLCPDPQCVWIPFALREARRLVRDQGIDSVLVTAPPFSAFQVGVQLKREFPHLKLICDFRDQWVGYLFQPGSAGSRRKQRVLQLEREAVETADSVVSVTNSWVQQLRERYPNQHAAKFHCVPYGYDPEVFTPAPERAASDGILRITYAGSVSDDYIYSPRYFLEALDGLPAEIRTRIEVRFIGRAAINTRPLFANRDGGVKLLGFMAQENVARQLGDADVLLLIVGDANAQAGKLFEYLAVGRPILALAPPEGEIGRLIRQARAGWCVPHNDTGAIRNLLVSVFRQWSERAGQPLAQPDDALIRQYQRPALVASLARMTGLVDEGA